jgi:hypothetical protein
MSFATRRLRVQTWLGRLALGLPLLVACGAQSNGTDNGGRTHWLRVCSDDFECGAGVCRQQRCTVSCNADLDCEFASDAACAEGYCALRVSSEPVGSEPDASSAPVASTPAPIDSAPVEASDASAPMSEAGIWVNASIDAGQNEALHFGDEVTAYTRDPNNRTLISLVATRPEWGSITLSLVSNPGPVSAGGLTCASGSTLISATMLTDTGILSLTSDAAGAGCQINVVQPGEQAGAPVSGTFNATLVSTNGSVLTLTEGDFRGVLNE